MNDLTRNILACMTLSSALLTTGCIDPAPPRQDNATDMSATMDARMDEPDARVDAPDMKNVDANHDTRDMPDDLDMREPVDMMIEGDMSSEPSCVIGTVECSGSVGDVSGRRVCGVDGQWHDRAACLVGESCIEGGECVPSVNPEKGTVQIGDPLSASASVKDYPNFGTALALTPDSFIAGAYTHQLTDDYPDKPGSVFTFNKVDGQWSYDVTNNLSLDDATLGEISGALGIVAESLPDSYGQCAEFGRSLAMSWDGLLLAVGAPGFDFDGGGCESSDSKDGVVVIYTRSDPSAKWTLAQVLTPGGGSNQKKSIFGISLAMSPLGDRLFVGSSGLDTAGLNVGGVFEYSMDRSKQEAIATHTRTITPTSAELGALFGTSISYSHSSGRMIVGAYKDTHTGRVYLVDTNTTKAPTPLPTPFALTTTFTKPDATIERVEFGRRVHIEASGTRVYASATGACYGFNNERVICHDSPSISTYRGAVVAYDLSGLSSEPPSESPPSILYAPDIGSGYLSAPAGYGSALVSDAQSHRVAIGVPSDGLLFSDPDNDFIREGNVELHNGDQPFSPRPDTKRSTTELFRSSDMPVNVIKGRFGQNLAGITPGGLLLVASVYEEGATPDTSWKGGRVHLYRITTPTSAED